MDFAITHTWDSLAVNHDPVTLKLTAGDGGLAMEVQAPFFNDPPAPAGAPGEPFPGLWDYEGTYLHNSELVLKRTEH